MPINFAPVPFHHFKISAIEGISLRRSWSKRTLTTRKSERDERLKSGERRRRRQKSWWPPANWLNLHFSSFYFFLVIIFISNICPYQTFTKHRATNSLRRTSKSWSSSSRWISPLEKWPKKSLWPSSGKFFRGKSFLKQNSNSGISGRFDADCVMKNIYETFDSANTGKQWISLSELIRAKLNVRL